MGQPYGRSLAMHEAAHCAVWLWEGLPPLRVEVNYPSATTAGRVSPDWNRYRIGRDTMQVFLASVIMAPVLVEGITKTTLHSYPPIAADWPEGCEQDARQAGYAASWLALDEVGWIEACVTTTRRSRNRPFRRLVSAIAVELEQNEDLDQGALVRIARKVI
jgi:hypothetical protein